MKMSLLLRKILNMKFYKCSVCGKMIAMIEERSNPTKCCGQDMVELVPNSSDGAVEKHVPVYKVEGNKVVVTVGSVEHPMMDNHYIEWIVVQTNKGNQRKMLEPGEAPRKEFALLEGEKVERVYAYCNLHGLFVNE